MNDKARKVFKSRDEVVDAELKPMLGDDARNYDLDAIVDDAYELVDDEEQGVGYVRREGARGWRGLAEAIGRHEHSGLEADGRPSTAPGHVKGAEARAPAYRHGGEALNAPSWLPRESAASRVQNAAAVAALDERHEKHEQDWKEVDEAVARLKDRAKARDKESAPQTSAGRGDKAGYGAKNGPSKQFGVKEVHAGDRIMGETTSDSRDPVSSDGVDVVELNRNEDDVSSSRAEDAVKESFEEEEPVEPELEGIDSQLARAEGAAAAERSQQQRGREAERPEESR